MAHSKVRIGFVGVGSMGQMSHLKNYAINEDCDVVAIAELRENTGRAVAARYGVRRYYREAAEMLDSEDLDAIVASQPFTRHGIVLEEVLRAGKPVFIEKPLAAAVPVGERIVELVKTSGSFVMVGYHKRSDPATMFAKARIADLGESGELGKITYVRILMPAGDWQAAGFDGLIREADDTIELALDPPDPAMSAEQRSAFVTFVNYYIHQVNLLRHLLGESYEPVFADKAGLLFVGESESGATGVIEMPPYRTTVDWQEQALVCFEKGWIRIDLPAPVASNRPGKVEIYSDPGDGATPSFESPTLPWVHAMKQQAANFIAAVKGQKPPMTGVEEALEDLRVARRYLDLRTTS